MQSIPYVGCVICGVPRDADVPLDAVFDKHEGDHQWTQMELVKGWSEEGEWRGDTFLPPPTIMGRMRR